MPQIPAFCDRCGTIFGSGIVVENSTNVSFLDVTAGPCPVCGGTGHVPDGVFNIIGSTLEVLSAPERTVKDLTRLAQIFSEAQTTKQSREEVAERVAKEVPAFSKVVDLLPHNRGELYTFLGLILATIPLLKECTPQERSNVTINQVVNQVVVQQTAVPQPPSTLKLKVGRNDPCPCGSGNKYKKCCGRPK